MRRISRRHALTFLLAFLFLDVATACGASLRLTPGGADRGDCKESACGSFRYAYAQSEDGDVIEVGPGEYGRQTVPTGTKEVTFHGLDGNKILQLHSDADNVTFDGLDLDAKRTHPTGAVFEHGGARNVTLRNSRVGNVLNEKGAMFAGSHNTASTDLVIDNVVFHDVYAEGGGVHNECIMAHSPGITIRNSTFRNCHTMDISLGRGDWYGQPPYGNVVLENNVFGHSTNGDGWHYYGLAWFVGKVENARVVNNTFENEVRMEDQHIGPGPHSGVWANNIGNGWQCLPGVTYAGNVGKRCGGSDRALRPAHSCAPPACSRPTTMPVGWVDPASFDFHLRPGSRAVDVGSAEFAPPRDHDGVERDDRPDAGAYELAGGGGSRSAPPPARPRLRSVRLRPGTICRRARRGCPAVARLRVRVSRPARVRVRVVRARGGRARTITSPRRSRHSRALRARALPRGRYAVRVVAVDRGGRRSGTAVRRLVVR